ncbi:MAG: DUF1674 domain-containing protein [Brevundimonas sp.]|uniref:DUF1674 domain-containing protein n=1 Tax=Brevundimonas sp. TaxID=1871086 RepID=UPI00271D97CA|nr:DUF1674 domain-containing protein [Brevundimonas sp.]MDO9607745.1 DUF1674 domain-containing protein [Brevundimonas sp.]
MTEHPTPEGDAPSAENENTPVFNTEIPHATPEKPLSEVARRALLEAADRRAAEQVAPTDPEYGGPSGPEPTRYGDWEKKGLAIDF